MWHVGDCYVDCVRLGEGVEGFAKTHGEDGRHVEGEDIDEVSHSVGGGVVGGLGKRCAGDLAQDIVVSSMCDGLVAHHNSLGSCIVEVVPTAAVFGLWITSRHCVPKWGSRLRNAESTVVID